MTRRVLISLLEKPIDLIIGSEFNFSEPNLVERRVGEKIPVAFKPVSPGLSQSKTQRLVKASVWKSLANLKKQFVSLVFLLHLVEANFISRKKKLGRCGWRHMGSISKN